MPTKCPTCGADLEVNLSGEVYCPYAYCPKKVEHKIMKMANKWNVLELGPKIVEDLVEKAHIKTLMDFFDNLQTCRDLDDICGKNAEKIRKNLKAVMSKPMTIATFLAAFDIEGFSDKKIQSAVDAGWTIDDYKFDLSGAPGWSKDSYEDWIKKFEWELSDVYDVGRLVNISGEKEAPKGGKLAGLSFCFTGAMAYKRADLEKMVVDNGGEVAGVAKTLSYLVQADPNSTSGKSEKAKKYGTKIISPEAFLEMIK